ncbi:integrase catalytic domain-containing protein [Trichonephila clavipes]|nr:integrase catalytic domain-containing protein [Trichonephila clavipes]
MQAFKDEDGLLRIRTKLADSYEKEDFKFPILLPANDVVVKLIREEHVKAMHAAKNVEVLFAALPRDRVNQTKIFEVTGVNFAGPLYLKSKAKAWIILFTCAVYRTVHFELVQSLTTDIFIQALRRFITRRGRISVHYSDNSTSFVGTNNALRTLDWDKIVVYSTAQKITWKLIPPTAAWWVDGGSVLPLTYIHEDPNELLLLSPAVFIHGNSNCETPDLDQVDRSSLVKLTKYLQKLREDPRQRFRKEYLAFLVYRGTRRNDALEVGDVVLIGKDGVPRVARIRTSHDERIRPFQRLYPLELLAKTEIGVLKASGYDSLPVEKIPESSTDHVSDSLTDYVPDSPVESTDNSEKKPPHHQKKIGKDHKNSS